MPQPAGSPPWVDFARVGPPQGRRLPNVVLPNQWGQRVDVHAARGGRRGLVVVHRSAEW